MFHRICCLKFLFSVSFGFFDKKTERFIKWFEKLTERFINAD
jgi:hypothetical protein